MVFSALKIKEDISLWVDNVIIGLNICPFAKQEREKLTIHIVAGDDHANAYEATLEQLKKFYQSGATDRLVVYPELKDNFIPFYNFAALIEEEIRAQGLQQDIQIVTFHPQFRFEGEKEDAVGNYVNRSPYPLLHFLNFKQVQKIVEKWGENIGEEISSNNNLKLKNFTAKEFQEKIGRYCDGFWPLNKGSEE